MNKLVHNEEELYLMHVEDDIDESQYDKVSVKKLAAYGLSFSPILSKGGQSGTYYAKVSSGKEMIKRANSSADMSTMKEISNNVFSGHASLIKMPFDPLSLVVALSLSEHDGKLIEIKEI